MFKTLTASISTLEQILTAQEHEKAHPDPCAPPFAIRSTAASEQSWLTHSQAEEAVSATVLVRRCLGLQGEAHPVSPLSKGSRDILEALGEGLDEPTSPESWVTLSCTTSSDTLNQKIPKVSERCQIWEER